MNINIDIYLRNAFQELSAFSIKGIGTFRKINRSSWIDETGLHLHPPGTDIEFFSIVDPKVLLSDYFSDKIGLDSESADQISEQISKTILQEVQEKGKFEIAEIGFLKKADDHRLTFENYDTKSNLLSDNYFGLSPINVKEPVTELAILNKNTDMKKIDRPESKQSLSTIGLKSSLLVALLFALGFILLNQSPIIVHRSSLSQGLKVRFNAPVSIEDRLAARKPVELDKPSIEVETEPSFEEEEIPDNQEDKPLEESPRSVGFATENTPKPVETVPAIEELLADAGSEQDKEQALGNSRGQDDDIDGSATARLRGSQTRSSETNDLEFHLIVGSFKSLNSANEAVSKWKTQGYSAIVLFPPAGSSLTHRVSVYKSIDRSEVERFANRLKNKGNKSTWIYEDKKQN